MKKTWNKISIIVVWIAVSISLLSGCNSSKSKLKKMWAHFYLEKIAHNEEEFIAAEQSEWSEEKKEQFVAVISDVYKVSGWLDLFKPKTVQDRDLYIEAYGSVHIRGASESSYDIKVDGKNRLEIKAGAVGSDLLKGTDDSYCVIDKKETIKHAIVLGNFDDGNGNTYKLFYGKDEANRLSTATESGTTDPTPNPAYTAYRLNRFYVKSPIPGVDDIELDPGSLSAQDQALYGAVLDMYGRTLDMSGEAVKFAAGSVFATYNPAAYAKSGNSATFTNAGLAEIASGSFDGNKFNLNIMGAYVFEYVPA
jgi:hypothetical protein